MDWRVGMIHKAIDNIGAQIGLAMFSAMYLIAWHTITLIGYALYKAQKFMGGK